MVGYDKALKQFIQLLIWVENNYFQTQCVRVLKSESYYNILI